MKLSSVLCFRQDMPAGDMRAMPLWWDGRAIAEEWKLGCLHD